MQTSAILLSAASDRCYTYLWTTLSQTLGRQLSNFRRELNVTICWGPARRLITQSGGIWSFSVHPRGLRVITHAHRLALIWFQRLCWQPSGTYGSAYSCLNPFTNNMLFPAKVWFFDTDPRENNWSACDPDVQVKHVLSKVTTIALRREAI